MRSMVPFRLSEGMAVSGGDEAMDSMRGYMKKGPAG